MSFRAFELSSELCKKCANISENIIITVGLQDYFTFGTGFIIEPALF